MITYRNAVPEDLASVAGLQKRYHISSIRKEDKADGFVTTLFSPDQFLSLMKGENGLAVACNGDKIISYAMAASREYWSAWPLFRHMIADLPNIEYLGPVCIAGE